MPSEPLNVEELVGRARGGDPEAFARLYDRHAPLVRAILWTAVGDMSSLPDQTQETFLRAFRKIEHLHAPAKFGAWVAGIARQVAREHRRAKSRDRHSFASEPIEVQTDSEAAREIDAADEWQSIRRALLRLDDREQLAIHLFYLEGQPATDAARSLGLSRSGIYALLERALARLTEMVRPVEQESERTK